jgi:hypothetical protein
MQTQARTWKREVDRLWSAPALDYRKAAQLVAEIARSEEARLRQAAAQALPNLRQASQKGANRGAMNLAHRRLGIVRDVLHALDAPRFGRRRGAEEPADPDEDHRRRLGLPLGCRLYGPEIHRAYKRAAKKVHPDAGGSERDFLDLSAARDALMKHA